MSPYPMDPVDATGPMRLVLCAFPADGSADRAVASVLEARLAACAQQLAVRSRYWWEDRLESAEETLVVFKTVPKRVGALFRALARLHPYEVPEILELDVPRVTDGYLAYLATTIDPEAPPKPLGGGRPAGGATRPAARRARGARRPGRTRVPRRRR